MEPYLPSGARIVEVGGGLSPISAFLQQRGFIASMTTGNLCYPLPELESGAFDAVLCLEVVEHIKDQADSIPIDEFNMSGARCLASEMTRALKAGGTIVCTTPNGSSYAQIARIAHGKPPAFHRGHVREYTVPELRALFEGAGCECAYIDTPVGVWGHDPALNIEAAKQYVASVGGDTRYREEDIIAVFRKR